jgi:hypothetical protein
LIWRNKTGGRRVQQLVQPESPPMPDLFAAAFMVASFALLGLLVVGFNRL